MKPPKPKTKAQLDREIKEVLELEAPWSLQPAGRAVLKLLITPKLLIDAN